MSKKVLTLNENTRVLYNIAKAKVLEENPDMKKTTDDSVMFVILNKFLNNGGEL